MCSTFATWVHPHSCAPQEAATVDAVARTPRITMKPGPRPQTLPTEPGCPVRAIISHQSPLPVWVEAACAPHTPSTALAGLIQHWKTSLHILLEGAVSANRMLNVLMTAVPPFQTPRPHEQPQAVHLWGRLQGPQSLTGRVSYRYRSQHSLKCEQMQKGSSLASTASLICHLTSFARSYLLPGDHVCTQARPVDVRSLCLTSMHTYKTVTVQATAAEPSVSTSQRVPAFPNHPTTA